jgi:WD repeat-containing protein 23
MSSLRDLLGLDEYEEDDAEYINSDDYYETDSLDPPAIATEPLEEGLELLASGDFGRIGVKHRTQQRNPNIVKRILKQRSHAIPVHIKEDFHSVRNTSQTQAMLLRTFSGSCSQY